MIKKEVKQYKQGNSYSYRINIAKQDNLTGNVYVLTPREYEQLTNENKEAKKTIANYKKAIEAIKTKIEIIQKNNQEITKSFEKINSEQLGTIKEMDKQHHEQLKEANELYIDDFKKFVAITELHNKALKEIDEMGFINILLRKYKEIIINVNKEDMLDYFKDKNKQPVYELKPK